MPKGDGTGPPRGPAGRGGRMSGTRAGAGPGGDCVCPGCGEKAPHKQGTPCFNLSCPKCGTRMVKQ
ncbi:hypothetical protein ACFLUS_04105 [Chloroflexota bacterium]